MIDTHAHLETDSEVRIGDLEWVVLSASSVADSQTNIEWSKKNKRLLPAVGVHPQELISNLELGIRNLEELLINNKNIVAVGECGLDFSGNEYDAKKQEILFRAQVCLALKYNKPLIIHSRKAMDETLEILESYRGLRGVIHCYSGGIKRIKRVTNLGFYFGVDGNLTYELGLQEVVKNIPRDRLVLETDSPELAPVPFRGERNYPEYIKFTYEKLAELWGESFEETEKTIDKNAKKLFGTG